MERKFKGIWIPAEIWLEPNLAPIEKLILAEIDSLSNDANGCIATNYYLANFAQLSVRTLAGILAKFNDLGYIFIENSGNKMRMIKINRAKFNNQPCKICTVEQPTVQNLHAINKVSKKELKKEINNQAQAHTYPRESYEEIFDGFCVKGCYRESLREFIKHLKANKITMINSRLERMIVRLDRNYGNDDFAKAVEIDEAIASGFKRLPSEYEA